MSQKTFYSQHNIGRAKYTVSFHDGVSTHLDGSDFFGIRIFNNQKEFKAFQTQLLLEGYTSK